MVAVLYALLRRHARAPAEAMTGALLASLILLARQMLMPAFTNLLTQMGSIFPVPGIFIFGLTLLMAMVLAFTGARVASGVLELPER